MTHGPKRGKGQREFRNAVARSVLKISEAGQHVPGWRDGRQKLEGVLRIVDRGKDAVECVALINDGHESHHTSYKAERRERLGQSLVHEQKGHEEAERLRKR